MSKTFQLLARPLLCVLSALSPGQGQLCTWIRRVPPAEPTLLQPWKGILPWKISSAPVISSQSPQNHNEVSDVCLFACFGKRKKGPKLSLGKCITHPSSGTVALAGKAFPHFLPLSVNGVVNAGKALGQEKAPARYQASLLQ